LSGYTQRSTSAPIASETLQRIATAYAVEAEIRGKAPEVRRGVRQERSRPLIGALFVWLTAQLPDLPTCSTTAFAPALNKWATWCE
jgi:transposase